MSSATTTTSQRLTKNQSISTATTPQSSKATVFRTVSGAYPSIPTNHKPMHCSPNKHNGTLFNGSMPPPSVQVSALSSRPPDELFPSPTHITTRTHTIYAAILDPKQPTSNSFSDLTGRFPIQSNRGANYIFILYDYDSNAIIVQPLRNRSAQEI